MTEFDVSKQDALIRALMAHPDNFQNSSLFALGYMSMMLARTIGKLSPEDRRLAIEDIDFVIDRHKRQRQDRKVAC